MATIAGRGARLTALALAAGSLVFSATNANAALVKIPDVFGGSAQAAAIHIEINLPLPLGGLSHIEQNISLTDGKANFSGLTNMVSEGTSTLGSGLLLNKEVFASLTGTLEKADAILPTTNILGLVDIGLGEIKSTVAPEGSKSVLTSSSASQLAHLRVGMSALKDALPALKTDLGATVTNTVEPVVNQLLGVLNSTPVGSAAQPVVDQVKGQVNSLLDQLQGVLGNLTADDALLALNLIESSNTITRKADAVTSEAWASVGGKDSPALSVLGGLITVDALKTHSFSTANGVKGGAAADTTTDIINVKVGDLLQLALTDKGLTGSIGGQALPPAINDAFQQVLAAANALLDVAGVKILTGQKHNTIDPLGKFASSSSEGVGIVVNPLKAIKPLVAIQLVPAGTAVNAARVAKPAPSAPSAKPLPRTGVELPLFALLGTGLAGVALVTRRRRMLEI